MGQQIDIINQVIIFAIWALSLNLLLGYAGQASIAHAALGAVGGYTAALLSIEAGWPFLACVLAAMVMAGIIGALFSLPALRLAEEYIILLTIALAFIVAALVTSVDGLGGTYGLQGIGRISVFGYQPVGPRQTFFVLAAFGALTFFVCWRLGESAFGRVLKGLREDERATRALGKNTVHYKIGVFGITSALAGLAGALFVFYYGSVSPVPFDLNVAISLIAMVILGGTGNLLGSILGAFLVVEARPFLQDWVALDQSDATFVQLMIYGAALILLMMFRPGGLLPERRGIRSRRLWGHSSTLTGPHELAVEPPELEGAPETKGVGARIGSVARAPAVPGPHPAPHVSGALVHHDSASMTDAVGPTTRGAAADSDEGDILVVRGLKKSFGGINAVNGVDLELPANEVTALIGPNGAGKSTLFNLFTGFIPVDAGVVRLKGEEITGMTPDRIAGLGMVRSFQDTRLFARLSVLENVMIAVPDQAGENPAWLFGRPGAVRASHRQVVRQAKDYLDVVGLGHQADHLAGDLSHGEQKLVAIARVLATGADVMLLDEPTSGVDPQWVESVAATIRDLPTLGKTVCIVEHNLGFLEQLNVPCYFMETGEVRRKAALPELMGDDELRHAYFGV